MSYAHELCPAARTPCGQPPAGAGRPVPPRIATRAATALLKTLVQLYRWFLSPWLGGHCRYHPSCSEYALEALSLHGPGRGTWLVLRRLGRCHPLGGSGFDPVPPRRDGVDRAGQRDAQAAGHACIGSAMRADRDRPHLAEQVPHQGRAPAAQGHPLPGQDGLRSGAHRSPGC